MDRETTTLEAAVWAEAEGTATEDQLTLLRGDKAAWKAALERLLDDIEEQREAAAAELAGDVRDQVLADFDDELDRLEDAYDRLVPPPPKAATPPPPPKPAVVAKAPTPPPKLRDYDGPVVADPPREVRLQAAWSGGKVVVWAGGPDAHPADNDGLADLLEAVGGPALGWSVHQDVRLPSGDRAAALSIPLAEALGWLVAVGAGHGRTSVGVSAVWMGRVALAAVRLVAAGSVVPTMRANRRSENRVLTLNVRWLPALVDGAEIDRLARAMPRTVTLLSGQSDAAAVTRDLLNSVVDAIAADAAGRLELPAPPPTTRTPAQVAEAVITRLDGSLFEAPVAAGAEISKRMDRWSKPVMGTSRPRLVVQLDPPDKGNAWFLTVLGPGADGNLLPIEQALVDSKSTQALADELLRAERILPALMRPGGQRRGQVYLGQDEAWELMTETGAALQSAGFEVRLPALSRRKPSPTLRLFTEPAGDSVVGANQLANVRWSAVFDDVELTAADITRLAAEARPLVKSRGRWVELDRVDLKEAAAALAERSATKQMTGAEILRTAVGLGGPALGGAISVEGSGWAADLLDRARATSTEAVTEPEGFVGELRHYQAEALGWLGFLDAVELGGCLALDMGLGKTPTVLAHLARTAGNGPALVIAPPAVVGNWAAEAARFTPKLKVVVHHGAGRATAKQLDRQLQKADVLITTYGTAVRDIDALAERTWERVVLDEAQAIKNAANETAQQLRRLSARSKLALTGTPIENGLGDLWSILDFTNPGLVGSRPTFVAQLSGEGEAALRALNGLLVFRRTKTEPEVAAELPDRIDELDHCTMTPEQIGLYQAVLDGLVANTAEAGGEPKQGAILAAITALKQICNHPAAYQPDDKPLAGRSGKLSRLEEIVEVVFAAGEKVLIFTHFATWGMKLAHHLTEVTGQPVDCYHGGLARGARDKMISDFQSKPGAGALVLSLKAGGTGLNLTAASHVVLYDRWWNPAVEDQARDRAWRIGQTRTVVSHRLVCPGTVDERVEEVVAGKRHIADLVLPKSSSLADLDAEQLRVALGLRPDQLLTEEDD